MKLMFAAAVAAIALQASGAAQRLAVLEPLDSHGRVTYFVAKGTPGFASRASDRELVAWALEAWEKTLGGALRFEESPEADALVRVYWVGANDGSYGEMQPLVVNRRRGAAVFVNPATDSLGGEIARLARIDPLLRDAIVYLTCVHELGHALGLEHTADFRDIMYFFGYGGDIPRFFLRYREQLAGREDIARVSGLSPGDVERVRTLYGNGRR